jgi:hypothetical protein
VAVSLPQVLLTGAAVLWVTRRWERNLPPLQTLLRPPLLYRLGWARWPSLAGVLLAVVVLAGVPLGSLVWRAGLEGSPPAWSAISLRRQLASALAVHGALVAESLELAAVAGLVTALLAVVVCWLALDAPWFRRGTLVLMAVAWALPGPVIAFGLLQLQLGILKYGHLGERHPLAIALWYGPSALPCAWTAPDLDRNSGT